ncbi:hypothetical protein V6Z12_A11G112400 [Gossypium hirsutum]
MRFKIGLSHRVRWPATVVVYGGDRTETSPERWPYPCDPTRLT